MNLPVGDTLSLVGNMICKDSRPLAVVQPSLLGSVHQDTPNALQTVMGPLGSVNVYGLRDENFFAALAACGGVVPGTAEEVQRVCALLKEPSTSRTISYLLVHSQTCSELLQRYDKLCGCVIAIVGCGGIGSLAALAIAGAGVRNIRLIDKDSVEASNLNRQFLYTRNDIGKRKIDVLADRLQERYLDLEIDCQMIDAANYAVANLLKGCQGALVTVDEPLGLAIRFREQADHRCKIVTAGYNGQSASVSLAGKNRNGHSLSIQWYRLPTTIIPSFGPLNLEMAGLSSSLLLHAVMCDVGPVYEIGWNLFGFPREWEIADQ